MNTSTLKEKQLQVSKLLDQLDRSTLLRSILKEHYPSFNQEGTLKTKGICKAIREENPDNKLPYKVWATNEDGQEQCLSFEAFKALDGHKFTNSELFRISKHWQK